MSSNKSEWPLPFAEPEEVGVSSERLSRIRPALQRFIDEEMDPNFITMVIRHGKIVHYEAQGYMDFESKKPVQKDTIYRLWSNTKPITGVATMICVEEGLLTLDDPVSKYIPAFKSQRRFLERVDFNTCPGFFDGRPGRREEEGLRPDTGPCAVITNLAEYTFIDRELTLKSVHTGVGVILEKVRAEVNWDIKISPNLSDTEPPKQEELRILRECIQNRLA